MKLHTMSFGSNLLSTAAMIAVLLKCLGVVKVGVIEEVDRGRSE